MRCEVCGSSDVIPVLDLGNQPLCDDLIPLESDLSSHRYLLKIHFCRNCNTALQEKNVEKQTLFPSTYHYRARNTPSVLKSMEQLVDDVLDNRIESLAGKKVLDVGCNDGSLLNYFAEKGAITYGIDPTDAVLEGREDHTLIQDFFSPYSALSFKKRFGFPDVVTFTNCFAHIENMHELITALSTLMGPNTLVIIENHYLKSVLEGMQFDTFYHEHPRTYTAKSFEVIADLLGARLVDLQLTSRYGGNIRAYITRNESFEIGHPYEEKYDFESNFEKVSNFIPQWKESTLRSIDDAVEKDGHPLVGIAFPGRASILINILGLTPDQLSATYEIKGSIKTGNYIPGTRIPILPEQDLLERPVRPQTVLNLAWHIEQDVKNNLAKYEYYPQIINILNKSLMA